jgi:hypothetical protein
MMDDRDFSGLEREIEDAAVLGLLGQVHWHLAGEMDGPLQVVPDAWADTPLSFDATPDQRDGWTYLCAMHPSGYGSVRVRGRLVRSEDEFGPTLAAEWELVEARDRRGLEVPGERRAGFVERSRAGVVAVDARAWRVASGEPWISI